MNKTILLVEDDSIIAMEEAMVLRAHGYNVITVSSGEEAVSAALSDLTIDLVLMDINLDPGMDGTAAAELILRERDIPLVFLSSHTEKEVVEKTEGITSYGYIVKNSGDMVMLTSIKMAFKLFNARNTAKMASKSFDDAFNSINDPVFLMDLDYRILNCNNAFGRFIGREKKSIVGRECRCLLHGTDTSPEDCPCARMLKSGKREKMDMSLNGRHYEVVVDPLFSDKGEISRAIHIILDVTKHKEAEKLLESRIMRLINPGIKEDELLFEDLFDIDEVERLQDVFTAATGVAAIITRPDGTPITRPSNFTRFCSEIVRGTDAGLKNCILSDSALASGGNGDAVVKRCESSGLWDAGARITAGGRHIANWLTGQVRDSSMTEEAAADYAERIGADVEEAVAAFREIPVVGKERFEQIVLLMKTMADTMSRDAVQNMRQARMLSELMDDEQRIKELLNEKEVLLKEVHHRIKNNMSTVEALLTMQTDSLSDKTASDALRSAAQRVNAVRILYEKLLTTEDYESLSVKSFIEDIFKMVNAVYPDRLISAGELEIDDIYLNSSTLIPLGLIINELLTNIYKHAGGGQEDLRIKLSFKNNGSGIVLLVEDNGSGFPEDFSLERSDSFGLKLVNMLSRQLKADIVMKNRDGVERGALCRLVIPAGV